MYRHDTSTNILMSITCWAWLSLLLELVVCRHKMAALSFTMVREVARQIVAKMQRGKTVKSKISSVLNRV